jgi:hypothetical protein
MSRSRGSKRMHRGGGHGSTRHEALRPTWSSRLGGRDAAVLTLTCWEAGRTLSGRSWALSLCLPACLPALWNSRGRRRRASYTRWSTSGETIRRCQGADAQAGRAGKSIGVATGLFREADPRLRSVKGRQRR